MGVAVSPRATASVWLQAFTTLLAVCAVCAFGSTPVLGATQNDQTQFSVIAGSLSFSTVPGLPTLSGVTLNGQAQTTTTQMSNFAVADATGSGSGWDVTVAGLTGAGNSAVFKQYCPTGGGCGTDPQGYVTAGATLPANSLTLGSVGASFAAQNGSTGTAPTLQCSSACNVDSASVVKVASAALDAGMGTWLTSVFASNSLSLATPSTLKVLSNGEVYRVNIVWTLNTGP
jgi:hypothetical protein